MHVARVHFQVFQVFHMYVTSVLSGCCICFAMATHVFFKCFSGFERMLQVFRLGVAKLDLGLHKLQWNPPTATACYSCWGAMHARGKREGMEAGARACGPRRVKRELLRHRACTRREKRRGMGVWPHVHAGARSRWGAGVRMGAAELPPCA